MTDRTFWTLLEDGPFAGDEGEMLCHRPPEYLRVYASSDAPDGVAWRDERTEWPPDAARYALRTSQGEPVVYVYAGVGGGEAATLTAEQRKAQHRGRKDLREPVPA